MAFCLAVAATAHAAIPTYDTYFSPKNPERPKRASTRFIILHTTEGPAKGSGNKLSRYGEANYMIDEQGRVYRIIDRRRVAYHCGHSMWDGRTGLDDCSIGIEMVGYHNKPLTAAQKKSLKQLLAELKQIYRVPDNRILTHSMVAYGTPNQWHKRNHRGRKRCGMLMATPSLRRELGLKSKPAYDPDVKAKRLVVADAELQRLLYTRDNASAKEDKKAVETASSKEGNVIAKGRSAWDIARDNYNSADTTYHFPDGTTKKGSQITNWKAIPEGTRVVVSADKQENAPDKPPEPPKMSAAKPSSEMKSAGGAEDFSKTRTRVNPNRPAGSPATAPSPSSGTSSGPSSSGPVRSPSGVVSAVAGADWNSPSTIYVLLDGSYLRGSELTAEKLAALSSETRVMRGYRVAGTVSAGNPPFTICGSAWNSPTTFYLKPTGALVSGSKIDASKIPVKTVVFVPEGN